MRSPVPLFILATLLFCITRSTLHSHSLRTSRTYIACTYYEEKKRKLSTFRLSPLSQPEFVSNLSLASHLHAHIHLAFLHLSFTPICFSSY